MRVLGSNRPVAGLYPYDTLEEAVGLVNDFDYGLQAGIFTTDWSKALYAFEHETQALMIAWMR